MKKKIINIVKNICFVLVLFFLAKVIYGNINDLRNAHFSMNIPVFAISLLIYLVYKLYNAVLWHYITVKFDCSIRMDKSIVAWSYSQLGKFVPGKVFYLLGRLFYYKKENIPAAKITFCFFLENAYTFLAALFMFIASLPFVKLNVADNYKYYSIVLLVLFFIFINPFFVEKALNIVLKLLRKEPVKLLLTYKDMILMLILFVSNWLVMGVGFFVLSGALYPLGMDRFFYLTAVFALSNVIGILSFFAPAGIGVRETILIFTLKAIMPASIAVIISIVSRVWSMAGELLIVFFAFVYEKGIKNIFKRSVRNADMEQDTGI